MKQTIKFTIISCVVAASANAALYTSNFEAPTFLAANDIAGTDGWVISDTKPELSFVTTINNNVLNQALALGGKTEFPNNSSITLSHAFVENVGLITATFDFAIIDSTDLYPNRDTFGFSLLGSSGNLFSVSFVPVLPQSATPDSTTGLWNAFYAVNNGANQTLSLQLTENIKYAFSLALGGSGPNTTWDISIGGLDRSGTAVGLSPTTPTTGFGVTWTPTEALLTDAGSNYIGVDDLTVVPEVSSSLLLALTGLGLITRRRRA